MVSRIAFGILLTLSLRASAELDLTPETQESVLEGTRSQVTAFRNGAGYVTWQPPNNWRITGGGTQVRLTPPDAVQAEARVEITGPAGTDTFDETFTKKFRQEVLGSLAREVTAVEWADDEASPLHINQHPTYKVTVSYTLGGQRFTTAVWLCNFARQQLRFRITARAGEFEKLHELFRESLYTWEGLD